MFTNFPAWSLIILYIVLASLVCFFSNKLATYVDALDKKTSISGAFIGGVLLAAVTSLPELFTSISATLLISDSAQMVVGNILGSNLFNLAIIGVALVLYFKLFSSCKIEYKSHFIVLIGVFAIYVVIAYGLCLSSSVQPIFKNAGTYLSSVNFLVILIFIIYGLTIHFQPKQAEEEEEEEKTDSYQNITLKQVIIRFIIFAVLLVAVSVLITYNTDAIAKAFKLDATLAGAIFLAIATSLPELVSTFTLCRKGNFNAALGDIIGSCLFNFLIIGLAEFMSYHTSLLPGFISGNADIKDAIQMMVITLIILVFLTVSLITKFVCSKKNITQGKLHYALYIFTGVVLTAGYIVFLII